MQYTVKSGDRLSEIARQLGVQTSDISGYKSGDPNLIYPGEKLSVNKGTPSGYYTDILGTGLLNTSKTVQNIRNANQSVAQNVPAQSAPPVPSASVAPSTPVQSTAPLSTPSTESSQTNDYRQALMGEKAYDTTEYDEKRQKAFEELQGMRTAKYDEAYKTKGLDKVKDEISSIDEQIQGLRNARDTSVLKTRQNPYLSASALTGDVAKLTDKYNADINTLIQQRNALAGDYNTSLSEIDKEVQNALADKTLELEYYGGLASERQKALSDALKTMADEEKLDRQLANALEIAQMRSANSGTSPSYQLVSDPYGAPLYWVDKQGQQIIPIEGGNDLGGTTGYAEALLKQAREQSGEDSGAKWYNPFSWF